MCNIRIPRGLTARQYLRRDKWSVCSESSFWEPMVKLPTPTPDPNYLSLGLAFWSWPKKGLKIVLRKPLGTRGGRKGQKNVWWGTINSNQPWDFYLVPPSCREQKCGWPEGREFHHSQYWHLRAEVGIQFRLTMGIPDTIFFRGWGKRSGGP